MSTALANAIDELAKDPTFAATLGANARARRRVPVRL